MNSFIKKSIILISTFFICSCSNNSLIDNGTIYVDINISDYSNGKKTKGTLIYHSLDYNFGLLNNGSGNVLLYDLDKQIKFKDFNIGDKIRVFGYLTYKYDKNNIALYDFDDFIEAENPDEIRPFKEYGEINIDINDEYSPSYKSKSFNLNNRIIYLTNVSLSNIYLEKDDSEVSLKDQDLKLLRMVIISLLIMIIMSLKDQLVILMKILYLVIENVFQKKCLQLKGMQDIEMVGELYHF